MLSHLSIRNLAIVRSLDIEFERGLNVVTGETGAGKSVILGAIRLLLGERADKSLIGPHQAQAQISAQISLEQHPELGETVRQWLAEQAIPWNETEPLLLRRTISAAANRCSINDTPCTLNLLRQLGDLLIDLFSPGEQHSLARPAAQREILDAFAKARELAEQTRQAWLAWRSAHEDLEKATRAIPSEGELAILRQQLAEIDASKPRPEEEAELTREHHRVAAARDILQAVAAARALLTEEDSCVSGALRLVHRQLSAAERLDPEGFKALLQRLDGAHAELEDISQELDSYAQSLDLDGERLAALENRLRSLGSLRRKYGPSLEDVLAHAERLCQRIALADGHGQILARLQQASAAAEGQYSQLAQALSARRHSAAGELAAAIIAQMQALHLGGARFAVELGSAPPSAAGLDAVSFSFAPNAGLAASPLRDIASSGELSRVMLAVKTVLARLDAIPILIFDEIDANIGGETAVAVAHRLRTLAEKRQLFAITHLPQVAAAGHCHFTVAKTVEAGCTLTSMQRLDEPGRVLEISRMLGGSRLSAVADEHARALLQSMLRHDGPSPAVASSSSVPTTPKRRPAQSSSSLSS